MPHLGQVALILLVAMLAAAPVAHAQKRVALVVGNSAYQHTSKLTTPGTMRADMAAALKRLGFQVIDGFDLDKAAFERKVRDFAVALRGAEAGLFFYAGHGLQVAGSNYLVPIDAKAETADSLDFEMVRLRPRTPAPWSGRPRPTSSSWMPAATTRWLATWPAPWARVRPKIGRGLARGGVGRRHADQLLDPARQRGARRHRPQLAVRRRFGERIATSGDDLSALLIDVRNDVRKETQTRRYRGSIRR